MKLLADIGVRAIRICGVDSSLDVTEGKYQFGMLHEMFYGNYYDTINSIFSPESLQLPTWTKVISSKRFKERLVLVAVDEAHCIAEWLVHYLLYTTICALMLAMQ